MTLDPAIAAYAATTVSAIAPYLTEAARGAAKKVGEEGAVKLLGWLREKLTGRAKEALDDLEKAPEAEDFQADLRKQLVKLLEANPDLLAELRALLPAATGAADQSMHQTLGAEAKGSQIRGSKNKVMIS